jgi:hypothetical protein
VEERGEFATLRDNDMTTAELKRLQDCVKALKAERERPRELPCSLAMRYRKLIAETKSPFRLKSPWDEM